MILIRVYIHFILVFDILQPCWSENHTNVCTFQDSFHNFKEKIKDLFSLKTLDTIDGRRKNIKKSFFKFYNEAFKDIDEGTANTSIKRKSFDNAKIRSKMSTLQLVASHGYKIESHTVLTMDGYLLTLNRIIHSSQDARNTKTKSALLFHGLLGSSDDWLLLGPQKALPYLLSNQDYDVWLANARGNVYSRAHATKSMDSAEFWDFSWHEIGLFDLPAIIEYIRDTTDDKTQINFIGYCMGTTALLVLLSTSPQYNYILKTATLIAPLAFMTHSHGPLRAISGPGSLTFDLFIGDRMFPPSADIPTEMLKFCNGDKIICSNPLLWLINNFYSVINEKMKNKVLGQVIGGGSVKTVKHYAQLVASEQFQLFNYGQNNTEKYNAGMPPVYRLGEITIPITIFSSSDDYFSTPLDILNLMSRLKSTVVRHEVKGFSHIDFLWAEDAHLYYKLLIDILEKK